VALQYLKGAYLQEGNHLLIRIDNDKTRGNGFKLERFRLAVRGKIFTQRVVRQWNRFWEKFHTCRCSVPGWMEPRATRSSGQQSCPWQGVGTT